MTINNNRVGVMSVKDGPEQLWFWDQHFLRNKKHPNKVLEVLDIINGFANLQLASKSIGDRNQQFEVFEREIICKNNDLRLSVNAKNLAVGCIPKNINDTSFLL